MRGVHQVFLSFPLDDRIVDGVFLLQKALRDAGCSSHLYCASVDTTLPKGISPFEKYEDESDNLLLIHYLLGSPLSSAFCKLRSKRILVCHTGTPSHSPMTSSPGCLFERDRQQLALWAQHERLIGAIVDSEFAAKALNGLGYRQVAHITPFVDLDRIRKGAYNVDLLNASKAQCTTLSVGDLCKENDQMGLVRMMGRLKAITDQPSQLLLVGTPTSTDYEAELRETIRWLDLSDRVSILTTSSDRDTLALYRSAGLYVSLSRQGTQMMPLVKAMAFDVPILAFSSEGALTTLGSGGYLIKDTAPERVAAATKLIYHDADLRQQVVERQRRALARYEPLVLIEAVERSLRQFGCSIALAEARHRYSTPRMQWVVEGPFDSSYSLAIVNRELARALARAGETVGLRSRDGPGPFPPSEDFLSLHPDVTEMFARARGDVPPAVCLRNQYPPNVLDMRGSVRVLASYNWEEGGFPIEWVSEFNATLDLITVASSYVAKVLRDNGVRVPIQIVGHGVDHILAGNQKPAGLAQANAVFRFLHVSSGFPRKGVDVLLEAWGQAFTADDAVELVIKTFRNVHNSIEARCKDFQAQHPKGAPIVLINRNLDQEEMHDLYARADALVCPTRGEGFGLPLAEALTLGKPVITTAYGGQSDFCTPETSWLCDYSFAYAQTHLGVFDSVWAEPDPLSLTRGLREIFEASPEERVQRIEAGRDHMLSHYMWRHVAQRTRDAVATIHLTSANRQNVPRLGWLSTWNSRCGIAAYAQSLATNIDPHRISVFATKGVELLQPDETFVRRCWVQGWADPLDELFQEICAANVDAVVIQFNFGFFSLQAFARLIDRLCEAGIAIFMILHSTMDVLRPDITARLVDVKPALAKIRRLLVHSVHDLNRLKAIGLVRNAALFPMGLPKPFEGDRTAVRRSLGLDNQTIIASFGYLLPHKGLQELINAFALLRAQVPNAHLLMLNALYPVPDSERERLACLKEIYRLGIQDSVTLISDFLSESDAVARLAAADIIVYPYQITQESASAAVKMGLGSLTPVAVTPLPIFSDVAAVSYHLPGTGPADIAEGLTAFLANTGCITSLLDRQKAWAQAHSWVAVSARLDGLIQGELRQMSLHEMSDINVSLLDA
jgi:glycosyltransferase involved in cell wall biosynthesis